MIITDVRTVLLTGPCTNDPFLCETRKLRSAAFIKIHTDTELIGLGETYAGYFIPEAVPSIVDFFKPVLLNQELDDVDELWRRMHHCGNFWCRVGLGLSVLNGIEAALWDLKGKLEGRPVHSLLGGTKHSRIPAYATGGSSNYPLEKLSRKIDHYLGLGFRAFKIGAGSYSVDDGFQIEHSPDAAAEFEVKKLEHIRRNVGNEIGVMMDAHMGNAPTGQWDLDTATSVLRALEPFNLEFFEEPLHYTDPWGYSDLCKNTAVPVAGGECLTGTSEWRTFIDMDCFDIGQPDGSFSGGLSRVCEIAEMLEERGRTIATHAWGAGGSLMQNVHVAFACPNTKVIEVPPDFGPLHREIVGDSFQMRDGFVLEPDTPGLGIHLTDEIKNRFPFKPGSGEFNSVPGKNLAEMDTRLSR
ncbi:MAG: mandelate racemase/muconate lactonizing enzyme family protein [Candidatus Omnitrophica bacterium]|nr:mandelate racemase/muconate lactonizing enzyme family protein [Candidatus Omnitrophota bacterium]